MLNVANKPIMLSVIMLSAVMLSVVAPFSSSLRKDNMQPRVEKASELLTKVLLLQKKVEEDFFGGKKCNSIYRFGPVSFRELEAPASFVVNKAIAESNGMKSERYFRIIFLPRNLTETCKL